MTGLNYPFNHSELKPGSEAVESLTDTRSSVVGEPETVQTFTAERSGLVVADAVRTADPRAF